MKTALDWLICKKNGTITRQVYPQSFWIQRHHIINQK